MKRIINLLAMSIVAATVLMNSTLIVRATSPDTWICEEYQGYIYEISEKYGICPELIMALIETESSGQSTVSSGACKGLMQINDTYDTQKERMARLGVTDIYDPYGNILVGVDFLMSLADDYVDIASVLMHYHGESNVEDKLAKGHMSYYARKILERAAELEDLHYGM